MRISPLALVVFAVSLRLLFPAPVAAHPVGKEMADAASNLLVALTDEQKAKAVFEITDEERVNWHFIPRPRKGLALRDMTLTQQQLAYVLIQSPLSHSGYFKTATIMTLDEVLYELENHSPRRTPGQYYISIFGTPGKEPWAWRVEGHHLSLNFTVGNDTIASTPLFFGSNPAEVKEGPRKGLRVLAREETLARTLVQSLTEKQRSEAVFATEAPAEIITGASREASVLKPFGISASAFTQNQRTQFMELLREFVYRLRDELADADWKKIEQCDPAKLYFAWAGGMEAGDKHYYRIQGPTFLMEYDKTQDNANHIHTVWRDLQNDFGGDLLKQHYQEAHGK